MEWKENLVKWGESLVKMKADIDFMKWLNKYLPDYECEYSGNLVRMYDAFCAGKSLSNKE